jgi:hypothetical protein
MQEATRKKEKGKGKSKKAAATAVVSCLCPVYGCDEVWTRIDARPDPEFQQTVNAAMPRLCEEAEAAKSRKMRVIDLVDEDD